MLGPLEIEDHNGRLVVLPGEAQRRLTSVLSLNAPNPVSSAVLENQLGTSPGALRTAISRLRSSLGAPSISKTPNGYRFNAICDLAQFVDLATSALTTETAHRRSLLESALGVWGDEPFSEFAGEPWADLERHRLGSLHSSASEELAGVLLIDQQYGPVLAMLKPVIARDPYRDRPQALRMACLALSGRPTEALRSFQTYREVLGTEVGTQPTSTLVNLDCAIAAGSDVLSALGIFGAATNQSSDAVLTSHNLPAPVSTFVGRSDEIAAVTSLLRDSRLLTLFGRGGSGKTRVGLEVARLHKSTFSGGIRWIDLGVLQPDADLAEFIAMELGVATGGDPASALLAHCRSLGPALFVVDNAEHIKIPTAALVSELLVGCPNLQLLVTSREALDVPGEVVYSLPPMSAPSKGTKLPNGPNMAFDAVKLFLTRSNEVRPEIVDAEDFAHVATICTGLDGLPLALELAAARTRNFPLSDIANGVENALLWQRSGSTLERHATLEASIRWSFGLIDERHQVGLTWLSTFVSPFSARAARSLLAPLGHDADEILQRLTDSSLLQLDYNSNRYRVLHTVKQFCLDRSDGKSIANEARAGHARLISDWSSAVGRGEYGIERTIFARLMPDVVAALGWARVNSPADAFDICIGLSSVRSALGYTDDLGATWRWLERFDRSDQCAHWAKAVAALTAPATGLMYDTTKLSGYALQCLPDNALRERGWLDRGSAMVPAYAGQLEPILEYADEVLERRDDLEASVYVGFACYMLAMAGQLDLLAHYQEKLQQLVRRHNTSFRIDSIGNGYPGAIIGATLAGNLPEALQLGNGETPKDPLFSTTSAGALAQAGVFAGDARAVDIAFDWAKNGAIPILQYLPALVNWAQSWIRGDIDSAADYAEHFIDEVHAVPLALVQSGPALNATLLAAGRPHIATALSEKVIAHAETMQSHPCSQAAIHLIRGQIAIQSENVLGVQINARALLAVASRKRLSLLVIDALEMAAIAVVYDDPAKAAALASAAMCERDRLGYRFEMAPLITTIPRQGTTDTMTLAQAVELIQES